MIHDERTHSMKDGLVYKRRRRACRMAICREDSGRWRNHMLLVVVLLVEGQSAVVSAVPPATAGSSDMENTLRIILMAQTFLSLSKSVRKCHE